MRVAAFALGALLLAVPAGAETEGWAYDLAGELMSPYCPGRTLSECPSPQAKTLRMWLLVQEAGGRTREEVAAELVERFGEGILPAPRPQGFGLAAYVIPVVVFVAGGLIVFTFLRRQTREAPPPPTTDQPLDPELERLVDEEISR